VTDRSALTWQWRLIPLPLPFGGGITMTLAADDAHLAVFAARPNGSAVDHVIVAADGTVQSRAPLPLFSVSGAAHSAHGFLVTGAGQQADGPAVCTVEASTDTITTIGLPANEPLAAWPVPVGGDPPRVVWATGRRPATVHCATLDSPGLTTKEVVELDTVVWSVEAVAVGAGLDVLCRTPEGAFLARTAESAHEPSLYPGESGLFPGVVISPRDGDRVDLWVTATDAHHEIVLPALSTEGPARVAAPKITADPDLLVWAMEVPDSRSVEAGASTARTISAEGWVAPLDRLAWRPGPAAALPTAAVAVAILGGRLAVADSSSLWIGERLSGSR
jgi:hypothetical protein